MNINLKIRFINFLLIGSILFTGCSGQPNPVEPTKAASAACPDLMQVTNAFYEANDAAQLIKSLSYLTEDVILVYWAEGINGHHMSQNVFIGKTQLGDNLNQPGLHRKSTGPDLPNFTPDHIVQTGNQLIFNLTPDRTHADGRPYNPFVIEIIFSGCRMDMIKIVERVTWV
jgi:hypothetical protein